MANKDLSHIDQEGKAHMVDIGAKEVTDRSATAKGEIILDPSTVDLIEKNLLKKGDVLSVAQIAGIQAAKKTFELIPLCHPIGINSVIVNLELAKALPGVKITSTVKCSGKTGAEIEALTAVSIAALTVYDMVKAVDRTGKIQNIRLVEKHGGKSGDIVNE
jgi:cyclic pyranopterin phosphate synthase